MYNFLVNVMNRIEIMWREFFDYGLIAKCPNCDSRTILSYPTTVCTKCQTRFKNDIIALNRSNYYYGHCGNSLTTTTQYGPSEKLLLNK